MQRNQIRGALEQSLGRVEGFYRLGIVSLTQHLQAPVILNEEGTMKDLGTERKGWKEWSNCRGLVNTKAGNFPPKYLSFTPLYDMSICRDLGVRYTLHSTRSAHGEGWRYLFFFIFIEATYILKIVFPRARKKSKIKSQHSYRGDNYMRGFMTVTLWRLMICCSFIHIRLIYQNVSMSPVTLSTKCIPGIYDRFERAQKCRTTWSQGGFASTWVIQWCWVTETAEKERKG